MKVKDQSTVSEKILLVRKVVEKTFGRKVESSSDCLHLSFEIFNKTDLTLNVNTLRRFFGLVTYNFMPSQTTLNILSNYCGYSSVDNLIEANKGSENDNSLKGSLLEVLTAIFSIDAKEAINPALRPVFIGAMNILNDNQGLSESLRKALLIPGGNRTIYAVEIIDIDGLCDSYGEQLMAYLKVNNDLDFNIQGNSILLFKSWLTNDETSLERSYAKIHDYVPGHNTSASTMAWYFSALLYYASYKGYSTNDILIKARKFYSEIKIKNEYWSKLLSFEMLMVRCLALTDHFKEALYYINNIKEKEDFANNDLTFMQSFNLWQAFVLYNLNKKKDAYQLIINISPERFHFLTRNFETIIYLVLQLKLDNTSSEHISSIKKLAKQTGFTRLLSYCNLQIVNEQ